MTARRDRQSNLLAALSLALSDRVESATVGRSGRGGQAPAALAVLVQQDGLGIEGLRVQLGLSQPATVRLVDGLVADGLAERRAGRDARSLAIALTRKGKDRAAAVLAERRAVTETVLDALSTKERDVLEATMEKLLAALTTDPVEAEVICRLCDLRSCPQARCPVDCAVTEP